MTNNNPGRVTYFIRYNSLNLLFKWEVYFLSKDTEGNLSTIVKDRFIKRESAEFYRDKIGGEFA